jgi:tetratricopeptide (TPR) repeat protein
MGVAGCSQGVGWMDREDRANLLMQRAATSLEAGDKEAAIRHYRHALLSDPTVARAHFDLAVLLQEHERDYVGAIYHFQQYRLLRPKTEKTDMIEERIRVASQLYAASVLRRDATARRVIELEAENAALKTKVQELGDQVARLTTYARSAPTPPAAPPVTTPVSAPRPATPPPTHGRVAPRTYTVKAGDTLASIATVCYRDSSQWTRIYQANQTALSGENRLTVGQTLIVP